LKNFLSKIIPFLRTKLIEQWKFVYFEYAIDNDFTSLPLLDSAIHLRIAKQEDIKKIEEDIFPHISNIENDKRYFYNIGKPGFKCFLAEKDNKIVQYFHVYKNASNSPLTKTPYGPKIIKDGDAYLGSTFTVPDYRSLWIVPHSIKLILESLKKDTDVKRCLVIVHSDTVGAINFYKRLGFKEIDIKIKE